MEATTEISKISAGSESTETPATRRSRRALIWAWTLTASGVCGIACGIAGLLLSLLAAEGIVHAGSAVRLAVPILIVACLSLLMAAAHAMDRLQNLRK
jgi:hypothetical protein